eukprot:6051397-Amphidinium_carterae.3
MVLERTSPCENVATPWLTRDMAVSVVEAYGVAWAAQDAEAILALFTEDAVYSERPFASDKA